MMPQVPVAAVALAVVEGQIDAVLTAVFDLVLAGLHGPHVSHTPGGDDGQIRGESLDTKLEAYLVVAFLFRRTGYYSHHSLAERTF